jgi:hypothetical protein
VRAADPVTVASCGASECSSRPIRIAAIHRHRGLRLANCSEAVAAEDQAMLLRVADPAEGFFIVIRAWSAPGRRSAR